MDEEVKEYIGNLSKMLSGQLRGAINLKARQENLEMIQLTLSDVWDKAEVYVRAKVQDEITIAKLKETLKDDENGSET